MPRISGAVDVTNVSTQSPASAGRTKLYPKSDHVFYTMDADGAERRLLAALNAPTHDHVLVWTPSGPVWSTVADAALPNKVTPGTYNKYVSYTLDAKGRITAVTGGSAAPDRSGMSVNTTTQYLQWTRVATARLTQRYSDVDVTTLILGSGSGSNVGSLARVEWGIKQQAPMGEAPVYDLKIRDSESFQGGDIKLLVTVNSVTESVAELWVRCRLTYDTLSYFDQGSLVAQTGSTITYEQSGAWQPDLPTALFTAVERTPGEVYVQQAQPTMKTPGLWVELNGDGTVKTMWAGTT